MSLSPSPGRSAPRSRGALLLVLSALLFCGAGEPGPALTDGLSLERDLRGGEVHVYPVEIQAGQFLRVIVQEEGIDLAVRLLDPREAEVTGVDGINPGRSDEDLAAVAAASGEYRVEIRAPNPKAKPGRYQLRVEGPRPAGGEDEVRAEAVRAVWDAASERGEDEEARQRQIRSLERALPLWQRLREPRRIADAYSFLAFLHNSAGVRLTHLGRPGEARKHYEGALAVARDAGDLRSQAVALSNIAMLDVDQGELQRGVEGLTASLQKAREANDQKAQARTLNNLGYVYDQLAERQKAIQYYQQFLELARTTANRELEATALNNLGETYRSLGDWDTALKYYRQALAVIRTLDQRPDEAKTLINIGTALQQMERYEEARQSFLQALATSKDAEARTFALLRQAYLLVKLRQPARAVEPARQAVELARGFPNREVNALIILGIAHRDAGDLTAAREELGRALALARDLKDRSNEAESGLALARTEQQAGNLTVALEQARAAAGIIESLRSKVSDDRLRSLFLATNQSVYELYIDILMASHGTRPEGVAEALAVSERARARSLLDTLAASGADIRAGADPLLAREEHRLRDKVNALDAHRFKLLSEEGANSARSQETEQRLEEALDEHRKAQADLAASSPGYAALTQPQPLSVEEIRNQVLDGRALLLEYALGTKRSFLWAVTPEAVASFELPGRETIEPVARRYYQLVTARNELRTGESLQARSQRIAAADAAAERAGRELSRLILAPAAPLLGDRPLLIVADGALQYIPFAALPIPSSGLPLAARHEVVILPSASALAALRREVRSRPPAAKELAVFADPVFQATDQRLAHGPGRRSRSKLASATRGDWTPADERQENGTDLPSFRRLFSSDREARTISALVPADQLFLALGFDASREQATSPELARYRNVHFATHGVLDSRRPELSKLVLSLYGRDGKLQDGFLRLNDIYNLRLNADLVVLSACRTALGKEIRGEGLVGLTRGFMYAGAARVLASLWSVEDRATADLMGSFYRGMLRERLSPAAALRKAQLEMAKNPSRRSPYFWAGFSLQGEWR